MRAWEHAATATETCGRCGYAFPLGAWMLVITLPGITRRLKRCATCEGPAPPDLPADSPGPRPGSTLTPLVPNAVVDKWLPYKDRE